MDPLFFFFLSVFLSWSPPFFLLYFPEIMISQSHYSFQILQPLTDCLCSFGQAETSCCHFPGWSKACDQNSRCNLRKNMGPDQSNMYTHACSSAVWGLNVIKMFDSLCSKNRFFPYSRQFFFFELPTTRTFFDYPWRFELSGIDRMSYVTRLSNCGLSTSDGVPNPDPKEYWNNWKSDMSLFSATNQERPYAQLLQNFFQ